MRVPVTESMMFSPAAMKIGDLVLFQGRPYYLRGLDPMSVPDRRVILEDLETGEELTAPADDVTFPPGRTEPGPPTAV
jgi:hypothetical protein